MAMVEPLPYHRDASGRLSLRKDTASLARAVTVASALGTTSAWTWLKMPSCDEPEVVYGATTLPCVVLGGVPRARPGGRPRLLGADAAPGRRARARHRPLRCSTRPDGDVARAVDAAAAILAKTGSAGGGR